MISSLFTDANRDTTRLTLSTVLVYTNLQLLYNTLEPV